MQRVRIIQGVICKPRPPASYIIYTYFLVMARFSGQYRTMLRFYFAKLTRFLRCLSPKHQDSRVQAQFVIEQVTHVDISNRQQGCLYLSSKTPHALLSRCADGSIAVRACNETRGAKQPLACGVRVRDRVPSTFCGKHGVSVGSHSVQTSRKAAISIHASRVHRYTAA